MNWTPADDAHWPGNYVTRWLAYGLDDAVQVALAWWNPGLERWEFRGSACTSIFTNPQAWAEVIKPRPPVLQPARWVEPPPQPRPSAQRTA